MGVQLYNSVRVENTTIGEKIKVTVLLKGSRKETVFVGKFVRLEEGNVAKRQ